jgi:hypothetical protein
MATHVSGDLAFKLVDTASELADATHEFAGDAHARGPLEGAEPTRDALQRAYSVDVAGWDAGLKGHRSTRCQRSRLMMRVRSATRSSR